LPSLNLGGGHLCADDRDDDARPTAPDPHLIAKGVPRARPAGCRTSHDTGLNPASLLVTQARRP
jgi:hypothetical protein